MISAYWNILALFKIRFYLHKDKFSVINSGNQENPIVSTEIIYEGIFQGHLSRVLTLADSNSSSHTNTITDGKCILAKHSKYSGILRM